MFVESLSNQGIGQSHHEEFDPPTPHCVLLISVMFCMLGGTLIVLSGMLSWIVDAGSLYLTDLVAMNASYYLFIAALVGGLMVVGLSIVCLLTEETHKNETWPIAAIVTAFTTTVVVAVTIFWINGDLTAISEAAALGPAPFIGVFGCVLTLAGGSVLTLNTLHEVQDHNVPTTPSPRFSRQRFQVEEMPQPTGQFKCPGCKTPVDDSWDVCPVCGSKLKGTLL
jgi:hypothetical protein